MKSLQAAILKNKSSELNYAIASGNEQRKAQLLADIARMEETLRRQTMDTKNEQPR